MFTEMESSSAISRRVSRLGSIRSTSSSRSVRCSPGTLGSARPRRGSGERAPDPVEPRGGREEGLHLDQLQHLRALGGDRLDQPDGGRRATARATWSSASWWSPPPARGAGRGPRRAAGSGRRRRQSAGRLGAPSLVQVDRARRHAAPERVVDLLAHLRASAGRSAASATSVPVRASHMSPPGPANSVRTNASAPLEAGVRRLQVTLVEPAARSAAAAPAPPRARPARASAGPPRPAR